MDGFKRGCEMKRVLFHEIPLDFNEEKLGVSLL
jgi:hypothetical protein